MVTYQRLLCFHRALSSSVASEVMAPPNSTVFSLIQPTGRIHLGNYLGAIKNWKLLTNSPSPNTRYIFGVADLHALTGLKDAKLLRQYRYEAIASIMAGGLDPEKCILYHQSSVKQHTELAWILMCQASIGGLHRMTQWKLKAQSQAGSLVFDDKVVKNSSAGFFTYPVLQAADILLYKSTHVPVGEDQTQHLELCRNLAGSFNHSFKTDVFPMPQTLVTPTKKVLSLRDPLKKMSKSDADQNSCVYVTDEPDIIAKKIRRAATDSIQGISFDPVNRPGVSNLITVVSGLLDKSIEDTLKAMHSVKDHKQLKDFVTEVIVEEFNEKRRLYDELMKNRDHLEKVCKNGTIRANEIAERNMKEIRRAVGLD